MTDKAIKRAAEAIELEVIWEDCERYAWEQLKAQSAAVRQDTA